MTIPRPAGFRWETLRRLRYFASPRHCGLGDGIFFPVAAAKHRDENVRENGIHELQDFIYYSQEEQLSSRLGHGARLWNCCKTGKNALKLLERQAENIIDTITLYKGYTFSNCCIADSRRPNIFG